ncbi:hypothetical protein BJ944DRAFT_274213 [Cunninghamella echinulata]|nr:hypothetical protein BJ944DRAFT_274213 [Cunninghamella echinulata]
MAVIEEIVEVEKDVNNSNLKPKIHQDDNIKNEKKTQPSLTTPAPSTTTTDSSKKVETITEIDQEFFYDAVMDAQELIEKASNLKQLGNQSFGKGEYQQAIKYYKDAQLLNPEEDQQSVYACNMAACYLKLNQPKEAKVCCDTALSLDPLYTKAILRRAQANQAILPQTSATLSDAIKDYQDLIDHHTHHLDHSTIQKSKRTIQQLKPIMQDLMEKEKEEMLGKLKDLGNTLLGKFGLSTDNFQFQKDERSGNYSMNFVNNPSSS